MRHKAPKKRNGTGKPVKRVSAIKKKRSGSSARQYLLRGWWILRGAVAGVLALGVLFGTYLGFEKVKDLDSLAVKVIEIEGCQGVEPQSVRRLAGVHEGDPLLRVDLGEVRQKVIRHPRIKDATVVRELPGTLRISVLERTAAAVVLGREFALVDTEGVVLSLHAAYPEGYPVITGVVQSPEPGRVMMEVLPAMEVLGGISRSGLIGPERISDLEVEGKAVQVSLMGSGAVLVFERRDADGQLKKLARLMEAGVFDDRSAGYDLRFEGRVISMPEKKYDASGGTGLTRAGG